MNRIGARRTILAIVAVLAIFIAIWGFWSGARFDRVASTPAVPPTPGAAAETPAASVSPSAQTSVPAPVSTPAPATAPTPVPTKAPAPVPAAAPSAPPVGVDGVPRFDHVVIVVEENHSDKRIFGNRKDAPYMNELADEGAYFTDSHALRHPSQPNYLLLFSGSDQGVTSDKCPNTFDTPNLASMLIGAKLTFAGYSDGMPKSGYEGCWNQKYGRKHNPWINFTNVPKEVNLTFGDFPTDFSKLPTVSFVIPNLDHDMHDGTIAAADKWLKDNLGSYEEWAKSHNSLLILTWDEDEGGSGSPNKIPTLFAGDRVKPGHYDIPIDHTGVLRTILDMYGLQQLKGTKEAKPITGVWER